METNINKICYNYIPMTIILWIYNDGVHFNETFDLIKS